MAEDHARKAGSNWHKKAEQNKGGTKKKGIKKGSKKAALKGGKGPLKKNKVAPEGAKTLNDDSKMVKPGVKKGVKKDAKKVKKKKPGP